MPMKHVCSDAKLCLLTKYDFQDTRVLYQTIITWFKLSLGFANQEGSAGVQSITLLSDSRLAQCRQTAEGDNSTEKSFWPRFFLQMYFDKQGSSDKFLILFQTLEPNEVEAMQ